MDDILATANLGKGRSIHVATLARQTIVEAGADHLGFNGYFVYLRSTIAPRPRAFLFWVRPLR